MWNGRVLGLRCGGHAVDAGVATGGLALCVMTCNLIVH
jgi:hypothetical protein